MDDMAEGRGLPPSSLATGHAEIDREHAVLLSLLDQVRGICAELGTKDDCNGCPTERVAECERRVVSLLGELLGYVIEHFASEEGLMKRGGFRQGQREAFERHVEAHARISRDATAIVASLSGPATVRHLVEIRDLLNGWLTGHITEHDRPMAKTLAGG